MSDDDPHRADATDRLYLDSVFAALADPTRRAILARLTAGRATVNELAEPFDISIQAVSKHLAVLERAGLISKRRRARWRLCHLENKALDAAVAWINTCRAPANPITTEHPTSLATPRKRRQQTATSLTEANAETSEVHRLVIGRAITGQAAFQ